MKNNYFYLLFLLLPFQPLVAQQLYQHPILSLLASDLLEMADVNSGLYAYDGLGKNQLLLDYSTQQGSKVGLSWVPLKGLSNSWGLLQFNPTYSRSLSLSGSDKGGYEITANLPWRQRRWQHNTFLTTKGNQRLTDHNQDGFRDQLGHRHYRFQHTTQTKINQVDLRANVQYLNQRQHGGQVGYHWQEDAGSDSVYGFGRTNQQLIANVVAQHTFSTGKELQVNTQFRRYRSQGHWGQRKLIGEEDRRGLSASYKIENQHGSSHFFGFYQRQLLEQGWGDWQESQQWNKLNIGGSHRRFLSSKFLVEVGLAIDYHSQLKWQLLPSLRLDYLPTQKLRLAVLGGRDYRFQRPLLALEPYLLSQRSWTAESYGADRLWYVGCLLQTSRIQLGNAKLSYKVVYQARLLSEQLLTDPSKRGSLRQYHYQEQSPWQHLLFVTAQAKLGHFSSQLTYRWRHKTLPLNTSEEQAYFDARHSLLAQVYYRSDFRYNGTIRSWSGSTGYLLRNSLRLPNETQSPALHNWQCEFRVNWKSIANNKLSPTTFIGLENILHQRQQDLYTAADEPYSQAFDGSNIWGDPIGQRWYAGMKFRF